jgi:hypothetical protein
MKLIVCGPVDFDDYDLLKSKLDKLTEGINRKKLTIHTGALNGVDKLAEDWAYKNGVTVMRFHPDYQKPDKAKNDMAKNCVACLAFWDGKCRHTKAMINVAKTYRLQLRVIRYEA